ALGYSWATVPVVDAKQALPWGLMMRGTRNVRLAAAATIASLCIAHPALAASPLAAGATAPPALWGDLRAGPFRVGVALLYRFDPTRIGAPRDDRSQLDSGERVRPVRISLWSPASAPGRAMTYADYVRPPAPSASFAALHEFLAMRNER